MQGSSAASIPTTLSGRENSHADSVSRGLSHFRHLVRATTRDTSYRLVCKEGTTVSCCNIIVFPSRCSDCLSAKMVREDLVEGAISCKYAHLSTTTTTTTTFTTTTSSSSPSILTPLRPQSSKIPLSHRRPSNNASPFCAPRTSPRKKSTLLSPEQANRLPQPHRQPHNLHHNIDNNSNTNNNHPTIMPINPMGLGNSLSPNLRAVTGETTSSPRPSLRALATAYIGLPNAMSTP